MTQQIINVGAAPNDGQGDPIRTAFTKCNNNFDELYARSQVSPPVTLVGSVGDVAGMTAYDEDILTNASYIQNGVVFDKLLESVILTPISVDEISIVDKLGLIINARILAYGSEYAVAITDPKTKNEITRIIDLRALKSKPFDSKPTKIQLGSILHTNNGLFFISTFLLFWKHITLVI